MWLLLRQAHTHSLFLILLKVKNDLTHWYGSIDSAGLKPSSEKVNVSNTNMFANFCFLPLLAKVTYIRKEIKKLFATSHFHMSKK